MTEEYDICPVCGWEADNVQEREPNSWGGANVPSLTDARENNRKLRSSDPAKSSGNREPLPHEFPRDIRER